MNLPIVLLTDFGLHDAYVGVMKGQILRINPKCPILDLSHGIPAQNVVVGAVVLGDSLPFFPESSIFCCVIDPGVGSNRKALAIQNGARWFIGPDNGIFTPVLSQPEIKTYEIPIPEHASHTFHGRDVFAPAAAFVSKHEVAESSWKELKTQNCVRVSIPKPVRVEQEIRGEVLYADHFGNLVTNLLASELPAKFNLYLEDSQIPVFDHYSQMDKHILSALMGSSGRLELSLKNSSAKGKTGWNENRPLELRVLPSSIPKSC